MVAQEESSVLERGDDGKRERLGLGLAVQPVQQPAPRCERGAALAGSGRHIRRGRLGKALGRVQALLVAAVGADSDGAVVQTEQVERAAAQPRAVEGGRECADDAPQLDEAFLD